MKHAKKKSSGWRSSDERRTWREQYARIGAAQAAERRRDRNRLRLWRDCPVRRCQRARACMGDQCLQERQPKAPDHGVASAARGSAPAKTASRVIGNSPPPVLSAREAADLIAAAVANGPESELLPDEDF